MEASTVEWPEQLTAGPGSGPALFLSEAPSAPAIGYVSPGVPIRVMGPPVGERIPVRILGAMKARGWLKLTRVGGRVQQRGRIAGTPCYVGPGDLVRILEPEGDNLRVEVRPVLRAEPSSVLGPFVGIYPQGRIAGTPVDTEAEPPTPGATFRLPVGETVRVYDRPDGNVVTTLPALEPPLIVSVLRDRGVWKGVRAGLGPYVVGYVQAALTEEDGGTETKAATSQANSSGVPLRLLEDSDKPLRRLPTGTRVKFSDRTMGILQTEGWAREL
ncbi:MAG: hypothetical protein AAF550_07875, partial [Myxococcota bacterium]